MTDVQREYQRLAVADSFDAMNSDRPYRNHLTLERIIEEFKRNRGKQFDPVVVDCFLEVITRNNSLLRNL